MHLSDSGGDQIEAWTPKAAEQASHQTSRFGWFAIWLGLGAFVAVVLALIVGSLLIGREPSSALMPRQMETTGSDVSTPAAAEPENDTTTGAPLTHLGPDDLVAGSQTLKHPAPSRPGGRRP